MGHREVRVTREGVEEWEETAKDREMKEVKVTSSSWVTGRSGRNKKMRNHNPIDASQLVSTHCMMVPFSTLRFVPGSSSSKYRS